MEIILTNILKVALTFISFALTYGICRLANAKTKQIVKYAGYEYVDILWKIENIVENCVIETNETFVNKLKEKGEFTKEKQIEAFNKTFETAYSELSNGMIELMEDQGVNVANLLTTLIEKMVKQRKTYNAVTTQF